MDVRRVRWMAVALLCCAGTAWGSYGNECRSLAQRLALDPGSLKLPELDLIRNCIADLQRVIVLGETPPEKGEPPACAPVEAPPPEACPVCPTAAALCPKAATARAKEPAREKEPAEDRRLKPFLPKY